jgi:cytochrome c biogenesis protein ResB
MAKADMLGTAARLRSRRGPDPARFIWRLLTSVRFALWIIGFLIVAGLAGTLLPQLPAPMQGNTAAEAAWLSLQRERFGALTEVLHFLGLFNVFSAPWFIAGLGVLVVTVTVCTVNRFPPTWRAVTRPPERVPDTFFERAHRRAQYRSPASAGAVEEALRRQRYRVKRFVNGGVTYLFADRYPWAQLGTFVSHLSLILLLAGALVSSVGTVQEQHLIAEGTTAGVFPVESDHHLQLRVDKFVAKFDDQGRPLDYRSYLTIMQNGRVVKQGQSTVNDPLEYSGFRFHQSTYATDGAALRIRDTVTGNVVYDEVLQLTSGVPAPLVTIRDDQTGDVIFSGLLVPTEHLAAQDNLVWGRPLTPPSQPERRLFLGVFAPAEGRTRLPTSRDWELVLLELGQNGVLTSQALTSGETATAAGLRVELQEIAQIPALELDGLPGYAGRVILEMLPDPAGAGTLTVLSDTAAPVELSAGNPQRVGSLEYTFEGQRNFTGITVRRDPGTAVIWVAVGLLLVGLGITFYVPRRRLWIRITPQHTTFAGLASIMANFPKEMRQLAAAAGCPDAEASRFSSDWLEEGQV